MLIAVATLVLGTPPASPQDSGPPVPGYVHTVWTTRHGMPQNIVRNLLQTRDGYLWVGTGNGLVRFDGVRFEVFDMTTTPELPSSRISALYEDADGVLWIGTDLGLARYADGDFTRLELNGEASGSLVLSIQQDPQRRLWIATSRQVLGLREDGWLALPLGDVLINDFLVDGDGVFWIGTEGGLIRWHGGVRRIFRASDGLPTDSAWPYHADRRGGLWVAGVQGLARLDRKTGRIEAVPGALAQAVLWVVTEDVDGRLWIGTNDTLFSLEPGGRPVAYPIATVGAGEKVVAITQDREGHLWFGVSGGRGGLHQLRPRRLSVLAHEQGLPCDNVVAVAQGPDGTVWAALLCHEGVGLVTIREGQVHPDRMAGDVLSPLMASLLPLPNGDLWAGTFSGQLFHLGSHGVTRYTNRDSGLTGRQVVALHGDGKGTLWIGTERGLHRLRDGRWTRLTVDDGLAHNDVRFITSDPGGALWIGTAGGVSRYDVGRFTSFTPADGIPPGPVRAIHLDAQGTVWIGTYGGGLARMRGGEITAFGTQGELLDSSVHRILEDEHGYLWLSGDRGIRRVSRRELNAVADGRSTRLSVDIFDERDGMKNAEANGMGQPSGWKMRDGSLWFPTQGGLVRVDPEAAAADPTPAALPVLEAVRVDGEPLDPRRPVRVPPGAKELEIEYTAPAFTRPEQIQFRYRLVGLDSSWIDAGTRRVAHYTNLRPGSYRFEVIARSRAGLWGNEDASLALTLQPHFYERRVARLAALLLLTAGVVLMVRLRVALHRRRAEELEAVVTTRTAELLRERENLSTVNDRLRVTSRLLEESHDQLLSVLDQLRIGVLFVDARERVLFVSRATLRLIDGDEDAHLIGQALEEVLPILPATLAEVRSQLSEPQAGMRITARLEPPSGKHYWTEIEVGVDPRDERYRIIYLYDMTETYELKQAQAPEGDGAIARLLGRSPAMQVVRGDIRNVARSDVTVLIDGETGTGKELAARAVHEASRRRRRSFVAVNCAGLTESLLASQLFGHKRGSFTGADSDHVGLFEAAQGGTLLLDEIGDMPISMQTHLLRVLQEREIIRVGDTRPRPIDVRLLASTHCELEQEVEAGRFRQDLLYRIRVARVSLPPLRQRLGDVSLLAAAFLSELAAVHRKPVESIARDAMERLERHDWPGNVRELKAAIEWATVHAAGPVIKIGDLPPELATDGVPPARPPVADRERRRFLEALRKAGGNRTAAARLLGIHRATLYRRLAALEKAASEAGDGREQDEPDSVA